MYILVLVRFGQIFFLYNLHWHKSQWVFQGLLFYLYQSSFGLSPTERDSFTAYIRSPKLHSIVEVIVLG